MDDCTLVTETDLATDHTIRTVLQTAFPADDVVLEEGDTS